MKIVISTFTFIWWRIIYGTVIPIVDLRASNELCAETLYDAALNYGFFYIINHRLSSSTKQHMFQLSKAFFDLDLNIKQKVSFNDTHWGYIQFGDETTDPIKQNVGDTKEGFYLHNDRKQHFNDSAAYIHPLHMHNQWLSSSLLPNWSEAMRHYMDIMHSISVRLARIIALSLNLSVDFFETPGMRDNAIDLLYLIHYGKERSDVEEGIFGTGAHTDYDLFTILLTDNHRGLQIQFEDKWIDVEYKEDALIVNIADTLQKWTNDMFKSALHRVVIVDDEDRYSIPYFVALNYEVVIDCLPNTVIPNHAKYSNCNHEPFKSGEYLHFKMQETIGNYRGNDADRMQTHQEL